MKTIEERMAGYSAYHRHPKNKLTHFFGVPMVYYSPLIALGWVQIPAFGMQISLIWPVFAAVMIWYFTLDLMLASLMAVISAPIVYTCWQASLLPFNESLTLVIVINIVGWAIQLIGHYFEGRRPALVDNLLQALMAPLFLIAEVLFHFGIRKELEKDVMEKVRTFTFPDKRQTV